MINENEYLNIEAVVRSEYSNIRYLHLVTGNVQTFVWSLKKVSNTRNQVSTGIRNLVYLDLMDLI